MHLKLRKKEIKKTRQVGFEPTRGNPNRFLVCRLNRSAIAALTISLNELVFSFGFYQLFYY